MRQFLQFIAARFRGRYGKAALALLILNEIRGVVTVAFVLAYGRAHPDTVAPSLLYAAPVMGAGLFLHWRHKSRKAVAAS